MRKDKEMGYYAEFDNLFVEHELDGNHIRITNVQMVDPADPDNTDKWIDILDRCTPSVIDCLTGQIEEWYIDQAASRDDIGDYRYEQAKDRKYEESQRAAQWCIEKGVA